MNWRGIAAACSRYAVALQRKMHPAIVGRSARLRPFPDACMALPAHAVGFRLRHCRVRNRRGSQAALSNGRRSPETVGVGRLAAAANRRDTGSWADSGSRRLRG